MKSCRKSYGRSVGQCPFWENSDAVGTKKEGEFLRPKAEELPFFQFSPLGNVIKLSEICGDSFCDKVSQVAQDSKVSQVPRMR